MTSFLYKTIQVNIIDPHIAHITLNRPEKLNSMNNDFWKEFKHCFEHINQNNNVKAVIVDANGRAFTAGLDLLDGPSLSDPGMEASRSSIKFLEMVTYLQDCFTAIEKCRVPVIVAVHGACIGGGIDLITACDIRLCTQDAQFCVKEVDIGIVADVGTTQRLPKVVGNQSWVNEVCLTARIFTGQEAERVGLCTAFETRDEMMTHAVKVAKTISSKSPVAIYGFFGCNLAGTKNVLGFSRNHTVEDGLRYVAVWNSAMVKSEDVSIAISAAMSKQVPKFSKL